MLSFLQFGLSSKAFALDVSMRVENKFIQKVQIYHALTLHIVICIGKFMPFQEYSDSKYYLKTLRELYVDFIAQDTKPKLWLEFQN